MLSKAKIKHIKSLQIKKFRRIHKEFLIEGAKSVLELIDSDFEISLVLTTETFLHQYKGVLKKMKAEALTVSEDELSSLGAFTQNNSALAIARMKENNPVSIKSGELALVLDEVKDPGNLGTIIRIADWYGIKKIICSQDTADFYNPKVISSTMGSFTRIEIFYTELQAFLERHKGYNVYGAVLDGQNIHKMENIATEGFLLMGNESSGIHESLYPYITHKVTIPRKGRAESLNVAVATAILCDNIMRGA